MSDPDREQRERDAVYDGWRRARTLEEVEEMERLVVNFERRHAERHPDPRTGRVAAADAEIARAMLKLQRQAIKLFGPEPET